MRRLAGIALAGMAACSSPPPSRELLTYGPGQLVPLGRLHSDARMDSVSATWASDELSLMKEPRLDPALIAGEVFRLLYRPAFRPALAIRVTDAGSGCTMIRKEAVLRPPRETGREGVIIRLELQPDSLVRVDSFAVSAAECTELRSALDSLHLEVEPPFSVGPDGETYLFERVRAGRYLAREVWSPDSTRSARYLEAGAAFLRWAPAGRR